MKPLKTAFLVGFCAFFFGAQPANAAESASARFRVMGTGNVRINGTSVVYRDAAGQYVESGRAQIDRIFGASGVHIELRLIELLSNLQAHFGGANIVLKSGYRSPEGNQRLRAQGKHAAQSSMHLEGGAADLHLAGVASSTVAEYARSLHAGGVGFYHGQEVHVDSGPARMWDERTSGTESNEPQHNAKLIAITEFDRYAANDALHLRLMRMTEYPFSVDVHGEIGCVKSAKDGDSAATEATLEHAHEVFVRATPTAQPADESARCVPITNRAGARALWVSAPPTLPSCTALAVRVKFCTTTHENQPKNLVTNQIEIVR